MYNSPIEMLITDIQHQIVKEQDEEIYKAVLHYIPNIDKEELLRALQYDRGQYDKGYADGKADATPKWISVKDRLPEYGQLVIVYSGGVLSPQVFTQHFWRADFNDWAHITHWMPLPQPPKGE